MSDGVMSQHWYRMANLRPRLHRHVKFHRHEYRGLIWYLLEDTATGRSHRFNSSAYQFIGLLNGNDTVEDIHYQLESQLDEYAPAQEDILQLLTQLHKADLLQSDEADSDEIFSRGVDRKKTKHKQRFSNPIAVRVPLWDPDKFLDRCYPYIKWLFKPYIAILWMIFIIYTLFIVSQQWYLVQNQFTLNALSPYNLFILVFLYPIIKLLHELGHAFSAKMEGGEVHEMGVNFLLFIPIPYVNVSTAMHFRNKYKRMLVSSAGIIVELFLAALGILLFFASEPSLLKDVGFNMFLIGGISSLFFNGNPFLKYDGYYILADAVSIPNLYQRSSQYWVYLCKKALVPKQDISSPVYGPGENWWFLSYGLISFLYRVFVLWFIVTMVAEVVFVVAVILGTWLFGLQFGLPLVKGLMFIINSPSLKHQRLRAITMIMSVVVSLTLILVFVPVPSYTVTEGVVWQPEEAQLIAAENGFLSEPEVANNQWVEKGTVIIRINDPFLRSTFNIYQARLQELEVKYRANRVTNNVQAGIIKEEINSATSELEYVRQKLQSLAITAQKSGRVLLPNAGDLIGQYVTKGALLGYVLENNQTSTIRMVVKQTDISKLENHLESISVKLASDTLRIYPASIVQQVPEASNQIPSAALSTEGGGKFIVDPQGSSPLSITESVFWINLRFDIHNDDWAPLGTRAYVRLNHGSEPVAYQLIRRIRQGLLRQFNV